VVASEHLVNFVVASEHLVNFVVASELMMVAKTKNPVEGILESEVQVRKMWLSSD
jgi:hypothetical protein